MIRCHEYQHRIRKREDAEIIVPICYAILENDVQGGNPSYRITPIPTKFIIDTGATLTGLNHDLSHYLFSTDQHKEPDYMRDEKEFPIFTPMGGDIRYRYTLGSLTLVDIHGEPLKKFNNIIVLLDSPRAEDTENLLGMNVITLFEKLEIDSEKSRFYWEES